MIDFYKRYIHPESPARAKIAIHLIAQGTAPSAVAAASTTAEKTTKNATTLIEKGISALGLNKTSSDAPSSETTNGVKKDINGTVPIAISDVRAFKASLQVSAGPVAVKDLSEFEDLDAKL